MQIKSCDIFCAVVDNYGDIGVCWRLARQMANEQGLQVRLWVDDLRSFGKLSPELDATLEVQACRGVEVQHWGDTFAIVEPADLVIGAFACEVPKSYVEAMASRHPKSVWLNLEYLSAEDWVEGCHQLPSPHPTLPLSKYFFFPGFTEKTGGLLLERDLLERRDAFQSDANEQGSDTPTLSPRCAPPSPASGRGVGEREYWKGLGVPLRVAGELRVSLFGYENEAMEALLSEWEQCSYPVTCLVPEGRALPQVASHFGVTSGKAGDVWQRGNLRVHVLPFVEQEQYDLLLWACDINFVRGEDSCVRAQWAGRPFIWQIYPQHDGVHLEKLEALRLRYTAGLPDEAAQAMGDLWAAWNGGQDVAVAWQRFVAQRAVLGQHGKEWANRLSPNSLALNLLDFYRQVA